MIEYKEIMDNKKKYLPLLLIADEQESAIDAYLERGRLYVMEDGGVRAVCVVTDEGEGVLEIKNLAVAPPWQRCGYGRAFVEYIRRRRRAPRRHDIPPPGPMNGLWASKNLLAKTVQDCYNRKRNHCKYYIQYK